MSDKSIEQRRKEIFIRLAGLVEEFAILESEEQGRPYYPNAHILLVGFDNIDEDDGSAVGSVGIYPANGSQAAWKSRGVMAEAIDLYAGYARAKE